MKKDSLTYYSQSGPMTDIRALYEQDAGFHFPAD